MHLITCLLAPTGPPVNVTVSAMNSSRLEVRWIKPDKSVLHGNLAGYEIEYRRVECSESEPVSVADSSWKSMQVANTSVRAEIVGLVFWSCYQVRMRAVTVDNGKWSQTINVRTKEHGELFYLRVYSHIDGFSCTFAILGDL